jgi:cardiolipin synthase A/B
LKNSGPRQLYLKNNSAKLVRGGRDYFDLLENLINEAKTCIHLQTYIYDDDYTGNRVSDALIRAAKRGVHVYMLLDGYGSQALSREKIKEIVAAGIFIRRFRPLFKGKRFYLGRRLHHKIVVVDACKSLVGGLNISDRYNDLPEAPAWLDWALYVQGEVGLALQDICKTRLRLRKRFHPKFDKIELPSVQQFVGIRVNDWIRRKQQIYRSYLGMLKGSSHDIIIMSAYFLPGSQMLKAILAAAKRGVNIQIVLTGNADVYLIKYAERYIYRTLLENNIRVFEYQKSVVHGKMAVCDGEWMTVGSYNINNLSAFASIELNLDVKDTQLATQTQAVLENIISNDCIEVTKDNFLERLPFYRKIAHHTAYTLFRFIFFLSTKQHGDR